MNQDYRYTIATARWRRNMPQGSWWWKPKNVPMLRSSTCLGEPPSCLGLGFENWQVVICATSISMDRCQPVKHLTSKQTNKQTNKETKKQRNKETNKQTNKQTDKQTNNQTNKQTRKHLPQPTEPPRKNNMCIADRGHSQRPGCYEGALTCTCWKSLPNGCTYW